MNLNILGFHYKLIRAHPKKRNYPSSSPPQLILGRPGLLGFLGFIDDRLLLHLLGGRLRSKTGALGAIMLVLYGFCGVGF